MNFDLSEDQRMMRETFARLLDEHSSHGAGALPPCPAGFDADAVARAWPSWAPFPCVCREDAGGLGLGLMDAAVLMEEAGRTLASGPLAETLVAARLLGAVGRREAHSIARPASIAGEAVVTLALARCCRGRRVQWVAGGAVADAVIARDGDQVVLVTFRPSATACEENLASTPIAELRSRRIPTRGARLRRRSARRLSPRARRGVEAADRSRARRPGARSAASWRPPMPASAKQFGQLIGTFQGDLASAGGSASCDDRRRQVPGLEEHPRYRRRRCRCRRADFAGAVVERRHGQPRASPRRCTRSAAMA